MLMNVSFAIFKRVAKFSFSSLLGFAVDNVIFSIVILSAYDLFSVRRMAICCALLVARTVSASVNYACNRWWVFEAKNARKLSSLRYVAVVVIIAIFSYVGTASLSWMFDLSKNHITFVKIAVEVVLFALSYIAQQFWVFKNSA